MSNEIQRLNDLLVIVNLTAGAVALYLFVFTLPQVFSPTAADAASALANTSAPFFARPTALAALILPFLGVLSRAKLSTKNNILAQLTLLGGATVCSALASSLYLTPMLTLFS